jgi:dipeptidyl-peptidase 4
MYPDAVTAAHVADKLEERGFLFLKMIEIKDIIKLPAPGMNIPYRYKFSPKGNYISYLWSSKGNIERDLWIYDLQTDTQRLMMSAESGISDSSPLTIEQQLARERERETGLGITSYLWSPDEAVLIVEGICKLIAISPVDGTIIWTFEYDEPILLPTFSLDGKKLAFVSGGELWCLFLTKEGYIETPAKRLTYDATDTRFNGIADQLTWEELGRQRGFWWLPDSQNIVMTTVTTNKIPPVYILNPDQSVETCQYVFPGKNIPETSISVLNVNSGCLKQFSIPNSESSYLSNLAIHPDGYVLVLQLSRNQEELIISNLNYQTGDIKPILLEKGLPWINVSNKIQFIEEDGSFIWMHERKGIFQLERRDLDGNLVNEIPAPDGMVHEVLDIDEENGLVYYVASGLDPRERHIFRSRIDGCGVAEQLTLEPGCHTAAISPDKRRWIHQHDNTSNPPRVVLELVSGEDSCEIFPHDSKDIVALNLHPPELISFLAEDNTTVLYGALYRPQANSADGRYPLIVAVYGGPHHQAVQNSWRLTVDLRAQYLAQKGYLVLKVDNRGTWGRGKSFESAIHLKLGHVEVEDQIQGIRFVTNDLDLADPTRVGIYGWSYGGYMSAMCLVKRPDVFSVAVAGAPVVQWEDYDAAYTERYMGIPSKDLEYSESTVNPDGYRESSILSHLDQLSSKLLVIHGMRDENVLFRHTVALIEKAASLGKHIDLLLLPKERHKVRDYKTLMYLEEKVFQYLDTTLRQT